MSLSTLIKLVTNQLRSKWARTLLSSMGIMIGVWAILLTVSLSQGLSDKLVTAVNSQAIVKSLQFYKTNPEADSFFELNPDSKWVNLNREELTTAANAIGNDVDSYNPSDTMNLWIHSKNSSPSCVNNDIEQLLSSDMTSDMQENVENCNELGVLLQPFGFFYEENKSGWYGDANEPGESEIVTCFVCDGENPLHESLGFDTPEAMVGAQITIEYKTTPNIAEAGSETDLVDTFPATQQIKQSVPRAYTISAVFDDRDTQSSLFGGFISSFGYINYSEYLKAVAQQNPNVNLNELGYIENNVYLTSFDTLSENVQKLQDLDYLVFSVGEFLSESIETAFLVISIILGIFAVIALIAALFGIINVMTISVLERQKEIGILKSLGTANSGIFWIFLLESVFIGLLGWLLGVLLTWASSWTISKVFDVVLLNNEDVKNNLSTLNITNFGLTIPTYMLGGTLLLAVIFTVLSGLLPSISAARQNPTEVLRSE